MSISDQNLREWERVEIERSDSEASHQDLSNLTVDAATIERYKNPPADTLYPLEYAYYLLGDVRGKTVLDFGCGNGENTLMLANRGARVISMDISAASISVAKKRLEMNGLSNSVEFFAGSAHDISLPSESVDVVFGMAILHHLDLKLASREVFRVLKKGGHAVFSEPVRNSKFVWFVRNLIPHQSPDLSPYERPLTNIELKGFAHKFSDYKFRSFALPHISLFSLFTKEEKFLRPLRNFDERLMKSAPFISNYATRQVIKMIK